VRSFSFKNMTIMLAFGLLTSCNTVQIGEPYSKDMDDQLNAYHVSAIEFINTMEQAAGKPAGAFTSDTAKAFYAKADADLDNLQIKADVLSSRKCPLSYLAKAPSLQPSAALKSPIVGTATARKSETSSIPDATQDLSGNCISIVIRNVRLAQQNLESDHKQTNKLSPIVGELNRDQIDAAVRVALAAIRAKKL
jgi:hypothetical protein